MPPIKQDQAILEAITKKIGEGTRYKTSRLFRNFIAGEIITKISEGIVTLKEFDSLIDDLVDLLNEFRQIATVIEEVNLDEQNLGTSAEATESQKAE